MGSCLCHIVLFIGDPLENESIRPNICFERDFCHAGAPQKSLKHDVMRLKNMKKIEWIDPWEKIENGGPNLVTELQKELPLQHVLYGLKVSAIAHRIDCDDVLFQVDDGSFAIVHLTWLGKQDKNVKFPWTIKYSDIDEFIENALIPDAKEYGSIA